MEAKVLLYPHLGYNTWIDKVTSDVPDDDEIKHYLDTINDEWMIHTPIPPVFPPEGRGLLYMYITNI